MMKIESDYWASHYPKNEIKSIRENLLIVLKKYDQELVIEGGIRRLSNCFNDILELLLKNTVMIHNSYVYQTANSETYQSFKPLKSLYSKLKRHMNHDVEIVFKFPNDRLKIDDAKVSKWMRQQLLNEIEEWNLPSDFGLLRFLAYADNDKEVLEMLKAKAARPRLHRGYAIYILCEVVMDYLIKNITLKDNDKHSKSRSYPQLRFLYELLMIVNIEKIEGFDHEADIVPRTEIDRFYKSYKRYKAKYLTDRQTNLQESEK